MLVTIRGQKINMPDFLCIGAGKSGTTSLYFYLKKHPEIFLPEVKEIRFFHCVDSPPPYMYKFPEAVCDFEKYVNLFKDGKSKKCGDISPQYLYYYKSTIKNIKKYHPKYRKLKFIVILRQPLERIVSQYSMNISKKIENLPFNEAIKKEKERLLDPMTVPALHYLSVSLYYEQLKAYIEEFGDNNVKIYLYEDLKNRSEWLLQNIFSFLGVKSDFIPSNLNVWYNVSGIPKSRIYAFFYKVLVNFNKCSRISELISGKVTYKLKFWISMKMLTKPRIIMSEEIFEYLRERLDEDIKNLEELIKKDLSCWRNWEFYYNKYVEGE